MVCIRCQMVVKSELEKLGLKYVDVKIGEAITVENLTAEQIKKLYKADAFAGVPVILKKKNISWNLY